MTTAGDKILAGAREALAIARGEAVPARMHRPRTRHEVMADLPPERRARSEVQTGLVFDEELVSRLARKVEEANDPANWITLTGLSDEDVISALSNHDRSNPREPHRAVSARTDMNDETSTPASSPREIEAS